MQRIGLLCLLAVGCTQTSEARPEPKETVVRTDLVTVGERPVPQYLTVTGSLSANRKSEVAAEAMGKVSATYVERGAMVAARGPLVRLDARAASLGASEAHAMAEAARSQRTLAQSECERAERLFAQDAINRAEYDRMKTQCTASEWSTSAALTRSELAGKAVGDSVVRAPFAGLVVERYPQIGEYVRPGQPVATLVEIDPLRLELTIAETQVAAVREGQAVEFEITALPGQSFGGIIRYLGPAVRRASRDFVVEAVVKNPDQRLRPGMFAVARVRTGERLLPVIPRSAVRSDGTTDRVFVVTARRLEERIVQLGGVLDGEVAVLGGVRKGERIAKTAAPELRDGARVE